MTTTTDKMNMVLPVVSSTLGPEWANLLNTLIEVIDEHDHSSGSGNQVTPAGILINAALDFLTYQIQNAGSVGLEAKVSALTSHTGSVQRIGTNLWWVNSSGTAVQITDGNILKSAGNGTLTIDVPSSFPHTVDTDDANKVLIIDTTAARTINLPAATTALRVVLKDGDGQANTNNISVVPDGTDLIDGANSTYTIDTDNGAFSFISDGTSKWYVI